MQEADIELFGKIAESKMSKLSCAACCSRHLELPLSWQATACSENLSCHQPRCLSSADSSQMVLFALSIKPTAVVSAPVYPIGPCGGVTFEGRAGISLVSAPVGCSVHVLAGMGSEPRRQLHVEPACAVGCSCCGAWHRHFAGGVTRSDPSLCPVSMLCILMQAILPRAACGTMQLRSPATLRRCQ